jgi:cell division protein ZapA (FtsZ GTPase activity inhibitor)
MKTENKQDEHHDSHHQLVTITINNRKHETRRGENSVEHLKHLGSVPGDETLVEVKGDKHLPLEDNGHVEISGGEVFLSHKKEHHHEVEITINGKKYHTHRGNNSVEHLRHLGQVPAEEILSQFKGGVFVDLANNAHVEICGGEVFASHVQSGGSS